MGMAVLFAGHLWGNVFLARHAIDYFQAVQKCWGAATSIKNS